ncbi:MAG: O-antigen ligase family protein [Deltaproteobacteria bacterium]|nr:O-antigen ligase family protein [Deltaproteobacteria bacterium]
MGARTILAALKVTFALTLAQFQAMLLFVLVMYWIASRWEAIQKKFSPENLGPTMLAVIIAFSIFVGTMFAMDWGTEYLLLAVMLATSIALALCDTAISICVFTALLFLRPWEIIQNNDYFAILPKATMSLCIMNAMLDLSRQKKFKVTWNPTASYILGFGIWLLVTSVKAANPAEAQSFFFDTFFKNTFLFVLVLNLIRTQDELELIVWTIVLTMFGVGAASVYQTWEYQNSPVLAALNGYAASDSDELRLIGFGAFENSNDIAALMVMVLPFCLVPALQKTASWLTRSVAVIVMIMIATCIFMAKSRGAQMGVVAMLGMYAFLKMKNRKHALIIGVIGALAMAGAMSLTKRNEADLDESKRFRMIYLETGLVMGVKNPLLGVGFNGYADNFTRYQTGEVDGTLHRTAHNSWVLAFGETGFIGIILFIMIFASSVKTAWGIRHRNPAYLMALIGYGIAMTFLSHTYFIYPYLLYALTGLASHLQAKQEDPAPENESLSVARAIPAPAP